VWDAETGEQVTIFAGHSEPVTFCAYSPDGRRIVSAAEDDSLGVSDAETGEQVATFVGHSRAIRACAFSPDARWIISASVDATLIVWDAEVGHPILTFLEAPFQCAAFGPPQLLAAGDSRGRIHVLRLIGLESRAPLVTPVRIWHFASGGGLGHKSEEFGADSSRGAWDSAITAVCQFCGRCFPTPPSVLNTIVGITRNIGPKRILPENAWDEPRLLSDCLQCGQRVRFNPFIVDNRECW